ncbi:thiamine-phosphate kinase [Bacillus sp. FJAT-45037]|uniref:thiamine-phosphate kinase n=1 Tax=Bacillus sp. FJAT-45037 TaxID=2011007 RepID=UPI000C23C857|nr:thiamine-phosphate kinase [Bacillus sp. FJAT-45037]
MNDEFSFISHITPAKHHQQSLQVGIGDDAAIYSGSNQYDEVVCVDTMVEGVHFTKDTLTNFQIGRKALAVNVSDLAAMGAIPHYYLVSLATPTSWTESELKEIYDGMTDLAEPYQMDLIGGDTVSTKGPLILTVTVIGRVEANRRLLRSTALPGDTVFLTGEVGGSATGLALLLEQSRHATFTIEEKRLILAHQEPQPQVEAGRIMATMKVRISLNDVSDGVASEAFELAEASDVGIVLYEERIPLHKSMVERTRKQQMDAALYGGEDFQLIGTIESEYFDMLQQRCNEQGIRLTSVGKVTDESKTVQLKVKNKIYQLEKKGYNHFSR